MAEGGTALIPSRLAVLAICFVAALAIAPCAVAGEPPAGVALVTIIYPGREEGTERLVAPGEWVPYYCAVATPYRGGKAFKYGKLGPTMSVSIDGGPPQPMRITVGAKGGMDALRQALDQGASGFTISCSSKTLGELPVLPAGRDIAIVTSTPDDLALLKRQTGITGLMLFASSQDAVDALAALPDLTSLRLHCSKPYSLEPLTRLSKLTWLRLYDADDLAPLARMPALRGLHLRTGDKAVDLRPLAQLRDLVALDLAYCKTVADLTPLAGLTRLEKLNLPGTAVADLAPLGQMTRLRSLDLGHCAKLERLDPLARLSALTDLDLSGCTGVTDLSPLAAMARRGGEIEVDTALRPQLAKLRDAADF